MPGSRGHSSGTSCSTGLQLSSCVAASEGCTPAASMKGCVHRARVQTPTPLSSACGNFRWNASIFSCKRRTELGRSSSRAGSGTMNNTPTRPWKLHEVV